MKLLAQVQAVPAASPQPLTGLEGIFNNVVVSLLGIGGIALFIMFIVGGFQYLTAGGNPQAAEGARKTLTYAILGMVLVAIAFLIIKLVSQFTGVTGILKFQIQQ